MALDNELRNRERTGGHVIVGKYCNYARSAGGVLI